MQAWLKGPIQICGILKVYYFENAELALLHLVASLYNSKDQFQCDSSTGTHRPSVCTVCANSLCLWRQVSHPAFGAGIGETAEAEGASLTNFGPCCLFFKGWLLAPSQSFNQQLVYVQWLDRASILDRCACLLPSKSLEIEDWSMAKGEWTQVKATWWNPIITGMSLLILLGFALSWIWVLWVLLSKEGE